MGQEKNLEISIMQYIRQIGGWCQKIQSGKMMKAYQYRQGALKGELKTHYIQLADKGTPDILAVIRGAFIGIEVKKDKKTADRWIKNYEKYKNDEPLPEYSITKEVPQFDQRIAIMKAGGSHIIIGDFDEFVEDISTLLE